MTRLSHSNPSIRRLCVLWTMIVILGFGVLSATPGLAGTPTTRVLMVGDSWAWLMWQNESMRDTFALHGRPDILEEGSNTTINGSTAAEWAQPSQINVIIDELNNNPDVEVVQITLGGNDFLDGEPNGWWATMGASAQASFFATVQTNLATIVDDILAHDPDLRVLVSLYDYVNFVDATLFSCPDTFDDLGNPAPITINTALTDLSTQLADIASTRPRVEVISHAGLMQYLFGIPNANPQIPPLTVLPPGLLEYPSPVTAMLDVVGFSDCIHLNSNGYAGVADNLWWGYYYSHFGGVFEDGFESGDLTGWN